MASHSITKEDIEHLPTHVESLPKGAHVTEIDNFRVVGLTADDADFFTSYPEEKRKSTFRKVDARLVPMLAVLYLISHIDRANIGNAKIEGMVEDLGMTGVQYNTVLSICTYLFLLAHLSPCVSIRCTNIYNHSLCSLRSVGSSEQYPAQEVQTSFDLSGDSGSFLGYCHDMHWSGPELWRAYGNPSIAWGFRVSCLLSLSFTLFPRF